MYRRMGTIVVWLLAVAFLSQPATGATMASGRQIVLANVGLRTPESVLYDRRGDVYLISNINGMPTVRDGNGFISRVAPAGKVAALKWIAGGRNGVTLNAPKGMAIAGETLYVADITAVRMFDRRSGAPRGSITIPGVTFLNDAAAGPDGSVYVTDSGLKPDFSPSGTDAVYRIDRAGRARAIARGPMLKGPNGVTVLPNGRVFIVTFSPGGETYTIGPTGQPQNIRRIPPGQFDGVEVLPDGSWMVSSWASSTVYLVERGGTVRVLVKNVPAPADIGYDSRRHRLLIPLFQANRLVIQPLR